ncbi:hypothetical protein DSO57_1013669 [Entomophthora muscae]|uniref:Uncharacterized protein n=1 Tax=Entomophthora muscae TaxID=34485 RepID=A0ACC2U440_9FUNG|nr:hypothetical protein DSO57_1013669 [Entomophthora muscae]
MARAVSAQKGMITVFAVIAPFALPQEGVTADVQRMARAVSAQKGTITAFAVIALFALPRLLDSPTLGESEIS